MKSAASFVCAAALAIAAFGSTPAAQQATKPKPIWARNHPLPFGFNPGEPFPTIALPSAIDGRPTSVAEFRGKKLIVNIFASW